MPDRQSETGPAGPGSGTRRPGAAYQAAFEAVFSILIGAGLGYWGDRRFGTEPWLLLLGVVIGFAAFVRRLVRLGRRLQATANASEERDERA